MASALKENRTLARRALYYIGRLKARRIEYAAECDYWHSQGYTPHYCIHGANLWVDYDCVCGPCEDSLTVYQEALSLAYCDYNEYKRRAVWLASAPPDLPHDLQMKLIEWGCEPVVRGS